jgi:phage baseplate assembly protein gpV
MPGVDIAVDGGVATVSLTTLNVTGDIVVNGDVIASGVSLVDHVHGGVAAGSSSTAAPS